MRWTQEQDEYLAAHAHKGAEWCRRGMFSELGVLRSADAIWRHAYRIGVSMRRFEVCPECEREVASLTASSGLCKECHMRMLATRSRQVREVVEGALADDEREYERNRKWLQRHYGEIVELSRKMSQRRSGRSE